METAWVGLKVGWGRASGNYQGGSYSVSQVGGVSDMAPACWLLGEGSEKEQWPLPALPSRRKLPPSSHSDAGQLFLPICL